MYASSLRKKCAAFSETARRSEKSFLDGEWKSDLLPAGLLLGKVSFGTSGAHVCQGREGSPGIHVNAHPEL